MSEVIEKAAIPPDFVLELSSGGGFTGIYEGHRLTADGQVVHWRTAPHAGPRTEQTVGRLDPETVRALVATLEKADFFSLALDQPGNMTVVLTAASNGRRHTVCYARPMKQHPAPVRPIVEAFQAALAPLEGAAKASP